MAMIKSSTLPDGMLQPRGVPPLGKPNPRDPPGGLPLPVRRSW
ncbi:MAG: hypothetical protein PHN53_08205 [Eubacteriales bacterium]|nr:hypothetical protein [Eubacteriales bacterium]